MLQPRVALERWDGFTPLESRLRADAHIWLAGAADSAAALILAALLQMGRSAAILCPTDEAAERVLLDLSCWLARDPADPERDGLLLFPGLDLLLYEDTPPDTETVAARLRVLRRLAEGKPTILVGSVRSFLHCTLPPESLRRARALRAGDEHDLAVLTADLIALGYERRALIEGPGQFAVRGGILDIFPSTAAQPVRAEFFGDTIERLQAFDIESQQSAGDLTEAEILPARELLLDAERGAAAAALLEPLIAEALPSLPAAARPLLQARAEQHLALLRAATPFPAAEYYLPALLTNPPCALDHLPQTALIVLMDAEAVRERYEEFLGRVDEERAERLADGELLPLPSSLYHPWEAAVSGPAPRLACAPVTSAWPGWERVAIDVQAPEAFPGRWDRTAAALTERLHDGWRALASTLHPERVSALLHDAHFTRIAADDDLSPGALHLTTRRLSNGFAFPAARLAVLTDYELFGWHRLRRPARKRVAGGIPIGSLAQLREGGYVVHLYHGVGVYRGIVRRAIEGVDRDYLLLEYAGGDKLYVPAEQMHRVQRYVGPEGEAPAIHRLSGPEWRAAVRKARRATRDLAKELLRIYAAREAHPGHAYAPDTAWQFEMEASFPYEETPDQLTAIKEVKADLESAQPMDRLVCGDVGFGKTEVAIRAAFKVAQEGKQVAVLVPTTILAQQHYETFNERLAPYPITIDLLSRFRRPKEQKQVVAGLKSGAVDIVIGTHRLLSQDIAFKDLGLIVVDEEQRFGVRHKERLKALRATVDVLTLSATPIPRTMHMALSGLREMSRIEDPPVGRLPVETHVLERNEHLMRDAIRRELDRGGQVYFVHNRVQSIAHIAQEIQELVPGARITVGHGQMAPEDLERVMWDFYRHKNDLLVCTSIIENGLDLPNVNTLIVDRADQFGLAQLYQLRGRVGRSDRQAVAYFTWQPGTTLKPQARERIRAIREFAALGSGYRLAMRDLEIRGAGELLGAEQHGFIASIGYELYCQLLAEAIEELRGQPVSAPREVAVDLPVDAYLPADYVPEGAQRMDLYRRMAQVSGAGDVAALRRELRDRFGRTLPAPADHLLRLLDIKARCLTIGLDGVQRDRFEVVVKFTEAKRLQPVERTELQRELLLARRAGLLAADAIVGHDRVTLNGVPDDPDALLALVERLLENLADFFAGLRDGAAKPAAVGARKRAARDEPE